MRGITGVTIRVTRVTNLLSNEVHLALKIGCRVYGVGLHGIMNFVITSSPENGQPEASARGYSPVTLNGIVSINLEAHL